MRSWSGIVRSCGVLLVLSLLVLGSISQANVQAIGLAQATSAATTAANSGAATAAVPATQAPAAQSVAARCVPVEVGVFANSPRIHVKCQAPTNNILYFAVRTGDKDNPNLPSYMLTILTTALTSNKALMITYNPSDLSGEDIGCLNQDCRLIVSVSLLRQ